MRTIADPIRMKDNRANIIVALKVPRKMLMSHVGDRFVSSHRAVYLAVIEVVGWDAVGKGTFNITIRANEVLTTVEVAHIPTANNFSQSVFVINTSGCLLHRGTTFTVYSL